jgi:hypothetical protein
MDRKDHTGRRTAGGRKIASRNALIHGLSVPRRPDPKLDVEVQERADLLAAPDCTWYARAAAEQVAATEIELDRIAEARHELFKQAVLVGKHAHNLERQIYSADLLRRPKPRDLMAVIERALRQPKISAGYREFLKQKAHEIQPYAAAEREQDQLAFDRDVDGEHVFATEWLVPKLRRLERYSRRAHARYQRAMEIWHLAKP